MSDSDDPSTISILLLGDPGCGKSTFISRLISPPSSSHDPPQLLRPLSQPYPLPLNTPTHGPFTLLFSDTSSPTSYTLLRPSLILLCYDISQRSTLFSLRDRWRKEVSVYFDRSDGGEGAGEGEVAVMVVGLKRDLRGEDGKEGGRGDGEEEEGGREWVYPEEGHGMATQLRCDRYAECSAVTGEFIAEVREDVAGMAVRAMVQGREAARSEGPSCRIL